MLIEFPAISARINGGAIIDHKPPLEPGAMAVEKLTTGHLVPRAQRGVVPLWNTLGVVQGGHVWTGETSGPE
jgi:hypothetical protein